MSSRVDSPLKVVQTITSRNDKIYSMCNLTDGRLVLGSHYIAILDKDTYKPQIIIENSERSTIIFEESVTICGLKDGYLASSFNTDILIYKIQKVDYKLIHKLKSHLRKVTKIIELEDGRLFSCSAETIRIWDNEEYKPISDNKEYKPICKIGNRCHHFRIICPWRKVTKILELEDGYFCSCSDEAIRILDKKKYKPFNIMNEKSRGFTTIIEIENYIISVGYCSDFDFDFDFDFHSDPNKTIYGEMDVDYVVVNSKYSYKDTKIMKNVGCYSENPLTKLNERKIILGMSNFLLIIDILDTLSSNSKYFKDKNLGIILSILVVREDKVLLGNDKGQIICYDSLSNQITSIQRVHKAEVFCIIKTEDNQIISSSMDCCINIYEKIKNFSKYSNQVTNNNNSKYSNLEMNNNNSKFSDQVMNNNNSKFSNLLAFFENGAKKNIRFKS